MDIKTKYYLSFIALFFFSRPSFSQPDSLDIYDFDFRQLSKLKITSASKAPQTIEEVPTTIYMIAANDIKEKDIL